MPKPFDNLRLPRRTEQPAIAIEDAFEPLRPEHIRAEEKQQALATLSGEGELRPNAAEATKLESLRRVLIYHKREDCSK